MSAWVRQVLSGIARPRLKWLAGILGLLALLMVFQMYQRADFVVMLGQMIWACF